MARHTPLVLRFCYAGGSSLFPEHPAMQQTFDRAAEDLGNAIHLEHVNVRIPDQRLATLFYAAGLGLTRDPIMMAGDRNMWINVGRSQFHLPTGDPQVLRGHTGIVIAGRTALLDRLRSEEHTSELQSRGHLVCRLLLEKKKKPALYLSLLKNKKKIKKN